jgi:catechol 2,3-dioxygenase-like lactoylglutathione lyase family enzyme
MKALGLVWLGVSADEYAEMVRLFRDVLGLRVEFEEPDTIELSFPAGERVQVFGPGHAYHRFFSAEASGPVPLFEVDDLQAARARLAGAGFELVGTREGDSDWEWIHFRGPEGNLYALACRRG